MSTHFSIATTAKGVLEQVQLSTPAPGPEEVLIKVHYAALIAFDTYQLDRGYHVDEYPHVLGFASAGEVKAVGDRVSDLKEGERVSAFNYPQSKNKALQEYAVVPRYVVAKIPDKFPLEQAASMPDNFATAMVTIFGSANLALPLPKSFPVPPDEGSPVLVYGAGASSGQYMVQVLKLAGYTNIFAVASSHNHAYLRELGAKQCFDYHSLDFSKYILQASGGTNMSAVIDCIAARPSMQAYSAVVGNETRVAVLMPVKEGDKVTNDVNSEMHIGLPPWVESVLNGARILPVYTFKFHEDPIARDNFLQKILPQLLQSNIIRPNPVRLLNGGTLIERVQKGLDLLRNNKVSGEKVVIDLRT